MRFNQRFLNLKYLSFWALRYWESGNVLEKTRNEFHAKNATIAKRGSALLCFLLAEQLQDFSKNPLFFTRPLFHRALLFDPALATLAPVA
jgi:hypothetical protein